MNIRDRVQELRRVPAGELVPHPHNWRTHSRRQQAALRGVLTEVGYADALIVRELPDGSLQLVDGHLRAETTPNVVVPVLVVDLNDAEAEKVLLTHDPLAAMAGADAQEVDGLIARLETENTAIGDLLEQVARQAERDRVDLDAEVAEVDIPESYQVVVECNGERPQEEVFERMTSEGYRCRVLTL